MTIGSNDDNNAQYQQPEDSNDSNNNPNDVDTDVLGDPIEALVFNAFDILENIPSTEEFTDSGAFIKPEDYCRCLHPIFQLAADKYPTDENKQNLYKCAFMLDDLLKISDASPNSTIKDKLDEKISADVIDDLLCAMAYTISDILDNIHYMDHMTEAGEFVEPIEYCKAILPVTELASAKLSSPEVYQILGHCRLKQAEYEEGNARIDLVLGALSDLENAVNSSECKISSDIHYQARAYVLLGETLSPGEMANGMNKVDCYNMAVSKLNEEMGMINDSEKYNTLFALGAVQAALAEEMYGEEKNQLYLQAMLHLEMSLSVDPSAEKYYVTGDTARAFAEDTVDAGQRKELYEIALVNFQKAHEMDDDPEILQDIDDVQRELLFL